MKRLRIFWEAYKKNIHRMFKSKAMLASIFIGPFIILLLVQSAYESNGTINLRIGIVSPENPQNSLVKTLQDQDFDVWLFQELNTCTGDIKKGYLDFCIDLTADDMTRFYVDESKVSLVEILQRVISQTIADQSANIREQIAQELSSGIQSSNSGVENLQAGMNSLENRNPVDMLQDLSGKLKSGTIDIDNALYELNQIQAQVNNVNQDTNDDLNDFSRWLSEIEQKAVEQRNTITNIEQYNTNCESKITLDENYLMNYASYDELKAQFTVYGQCKCVDFYRPNIISIENDLNDVISRINSARITLGDARNRNTVFYNSISSMINEQRQALSSTKMDAQTSAQNMDAEISNLQNQLNSLTTSIDNLAANSGKIRDLTGNLESRLVNPINIEVNTISKKHDMIVYLFPMMYFFILIFVSLLFSGIFAFSEIHSNAKNRNNLSPASQIILIVSLFASLLTLIMVQGTLLILLGKLAFMFPLSLAIFGKIILTTFIIISFYIIVGIFVGTVMNSQLMVTFIIIALSILSLLYSELLIPSNIMTPMAQQVVSLNPFSIGVETASKVILYDIGLSVFSEALIIVIASCILWFIVTFIVYKKRISQN